MRELYKALAVLDFRRTHRGRSRNDCHIYERVDGLVELDVQLWPDGRHRVSHFAAGRCIDYPTPFRDAQGLARAVMKQLRLGQKRLRERGLR